MVMLRLLMLSVLAECCSGVIYSLNESVYNRMPPLFKLDDYSSCLLEEGGTYCIVDVDLYSKTQSELMDIIKEYSDHKVKHYNHTQIHRGVCMTRSCHQYLPDMSNDTVDPREILAACLNESISKEYKLNGQLAKLHYCERKDDTVVLDASDYIMAVVYLVLIMLNTVGSLFDIIMYKKEDKSGNPYLLAFSVRRNWYKLVAPAVSCENEPRLERLKLFHGLRTMTMVCVFFSHTVLLMAFAYVDNPLYIEKSYEDPLKQLLFNGSLVTHTFFVMSSFLMAYNLEMYAEKYQISWWLWPKGVLMRWLRLTPTYALVIGTISTWMRHVGSGPLWQLVVTSESTACRQYWWAHLLFINNYIYDDAECAPATWYLAADTQLFCLGLLICVVARRPKTRVLTLAGLFLVALLTPALHTYFQDLEAVVIQSPESYRSLYAADDTFRIVYIRGHTNLSTYTLGLAGGFLTYYWQNQNKDFSKYKNYRWVVWVLFPLAVAVILSGGVFYADGVAVSPALRVLYAVTYKPVFQALVVTFIMGVIYKMESVYRGIVEWRGFTWTGRVSYSGFLLHTIFLRALVASYPHTIHMTDYFVFMFLCGTIFITYMCAAALWLCVEAPIATFIKAVMDGGGKGRKRGDTDEEGTKV